MTAWFLGVEERLAARPVRRRPLRDGMTAAAVLVPLYVHHGNLWLLLTRRSEHLPHHAGQVAFPGGVCDPGDGDEVGTAVREAQEELGIPPDVVRVLGFLDDLETPSGYHILPVVGALPWPLDLAPAVEEVEAVVPVPWEYISRPELVSTELLPVAGATVPSPVFLYRGHRIWGATARVLADLVERLSGVRLVGELEPQRP